MSSKKNRKKIKASDAEAEKVKFGLQDINIDYPIFCFRYLQNNKPKDHELYSTFVLRLKAISAFTWKQVGTNDKHSYGTEKIPVKKIKLSLSAFVTPDIDKLVVFRAAGDNRPFVGLSRNGIFHVIFIEENFGDVYDH